MAKPWEKYQSSAPADTASSPEEPASAAVAPPSSADQATAKNDAEYEAAKAKLKGDYEDKKKANSMAGMSDVKFGDFETQIPTFFTTPTGMVMGGAAAYGTAVAAKKAGEKAWEAGKKVYGSLRDFSKEKFGDDGLFAAQQAEKAAAQQTQPVTETFTPEKVPTAEQETQKIVEQGKIKTGKAGGSITPQEGGTLGGEIAGKVKAETAQAAQPPEGYIYNYMKGKKKKDGTVEYKNKMGSDVIGKGGWNWYQGQMGPEAEKNWVEAFGKTNQSYEEVKNAIKEGRLKGPEVVEGRGGSFKREPIVPEYIRGSAPVETMARTGLAALGAIPVVQKLSQGDFKGALNEAIPASAMIDPRISLALSPLYTSDEEIAILKKAEQGRKVGAGRGIAPPSDYMR